jgi:copper homeostasis protein
MKIELCAASIESISLAKELGMDRIELCQNLEQGGLTPSVGFIDYALSAGLETHVLIRPRAGGFCYNEDEFLIMLREIEYCKKIGVHGIVIGVLTEKNEIHLEQLERISDISDSLQVTFHRAFDDTIEWKRSMELLINLGVKRILTSGVSSNVDSGFIVLKEMVKFAKGRIEIMVGGGVNAANVQKIAKEINPDAIHFSGTSKVLLDEESLFSETILQVERKKVARITELIRTV